MACDDLRVAIHSPSRDDASSRASCLLDHHCNVVEVSRLRMQTHTKILVHMWWLVTFALGSFSAILSMLYLYARVMLMSRVEIL
jgi:hypothetical protein